MSILQSAPRFDASAAAALAETLFDVRGSVLPLPSERDQNFRVDAPGGRFVLKIANATESRALLEAQNAALAHLGSRTPYCPQVVPARDLSAIATTPTGHFVRLLTWIEGVPLARISRRSPALHEDLGRRLGEVDRALASFDHPAIHRPFHWDLRSALATIEQNLPLVDDPELRGIVGREAEKIGAGDTSIGDLRRAAIHNDPNDYNVLVGGGTDLWSRNQHVTGLIDFGDLIHSVAIGDLAIAIAYAMLDAREPLAVGAAIVRGYHAASPLLERELSSLFSLIKLRLCLSASLAGRQQRERPHDQYLIISQAGIRRVLPLLANTPAALAEAVFRHACGLSPVPRTDRVLQWLRQDAGASVHAEVCRGLQHSSVVLDLGVTSPHIAADPRANTERELTLRLDQKMREAGASVAIGRYGEPRLLYSSAAFTSGDRSSERRTVHLGLDLFAKPGTPVHAPLAGRVHTVADNTAAMDYGPIVILEHEAAGGDLFFTIYGHLSRESIAQLRPGQRVERGDAFASIGAAAVNGGWTPHLHFQIATDLIDLAKNYPGVCRSSEWPIWTAFSPNPNVILRLSTEVDASAALDSGAVAARQDATGRNVRLAYRTPVQPARGWMQFLFERSGRCLLDAYNNVPHVGHSHPRVVQAVAEQTRLLNTNTRYVYEMLAAFAERLRSTFPPALRVCYFVNSGSEANELALRLARAHTGSRDVIVLASAYHGNTTTLIDISPYKFEGPGGAGRQPWVHVVPLPDVYRGRWKQSDPDAAQNYAAHVADAIASMPAGTRPTFIAETCPSVAGQVVFPAGYLEKVYQHVRQARGVCIADEVQTAYGRMGTSFYAFEDQHVTPDVVVLGKPIGNGYPLGAVVTTDEIARSFDNGMEFFSTFGGSAVSCAAGLAVLDVVQSENLQAHASRVGSRLRERLDLLQQRLPLIGDVRGSGLFVGVELVADRDSRLPAGEEAAYIANRLREEGILIGTDGPFDNVLKIRPPMPFSEDDADLLVDTLGRVMDELAD